MAVAESPREIVKIGTFSVVELGSLGDVVRSKESTETLVTDKLFVAVGKVFKESKSVVAWALQNSRGKEICIVHVHVPAKTIPILGVKFLINQAAEEQVMMYHEKEKDEILTVLDKYAQLCAQKGVRAHKLYIEADSVVNGIVTLISQNKIGRFVMGAAGDGRFSRKMVEPRSKKANQVLSKAPDFCLVQFVCKGHLIYTRQDIKLQDDADCATEHANSTYSRSISMRQNGLGDVNQGKHQKSAPDVSEWSTLRTSMNLKGSTYGFDGWSSSVSASGGSTSRPSLNTTKWKNELQQIAPHDVGSRSGSSSPPSVSERDTNEELYDKFKEAVAEADKLGREAFAQYDEHIKAVKEAIETIHKKRKEIEEKLVKEKEELDSLKSRQEEVLQQEVLQQLRRAKEWETSHESQIGKRPYAEFSFSEISDATDNFNNSMKIGQGGHGSIYRACLRYCTVAIKVPNPGNSHGSPQFQQEVDVLSTVRHPNIVTLIGISREASALIYEYLPYGSLEDRLNCKGNSSPLSWQNRIQIAAELCSVLIFLHSNKPKVIIHGDLKPANILLDAQLSCKLSDFGICRGISNGEMSVENATMIYRTAPKGTFAYIDPEFLFTGELSPKSDIYSYGVILLQLLTGKEALGLAKLVKRALDDDKLDAVLDRSAGDWPSVQVKQLALLALKCCEMCRCDRPDLVTDIWTVIEPMRVSCRSSLSVQMGSGRVGDEFGRPPAHFVCPIFQKVMHDPQMLSDGYTYEADAIRGWLDNGHETSPVTNQKLPNNILIPNRALCSAIQEWLQQRSKA